MAQEKYFENKVKKFLSERSAWYLKYWAGSKFTKEGISDLLVCDNGDFIGIEVKAEDGKPTMLQIVTLDKIRKAGGYGILLYPRDFTRFKEFMNDRKSNHDFYLSNIEEQFYWKAKLMGG